MNVPYPELLPPVNACLLHTLPIAYSDAVESARIPGEQSIHLPKQTLNQLVAQLLVCYWWNWSVAIQMMDF